MPPMHRPLVLALLLVPSTPFAQGRTPVEVEAAPAEVWGTVEERGTQRPLAGFEVAIQPPGGEPVTTTTDEYGEFRLPWVQDIGAGRAPSFSVHPPSGWRLRYAPEFVGKWLNMPLILQAVPTPTAPFRGRAVDANTGAPLDLLPLRIEEEGGPREVCTTDAEGCFTTKYEYARRKITVRFFEHGLEGGEACAFRHDFATEGVAPPGARTIALPSGPRFEVAFTMPPGRSVDDYFAWRTNHDWPARYGRQYHPSVPEGRILDVTRLHAGTDGVPWCCFGFHRANRDAPPDQLYLLSRDGLSGARRSLTSHEASHEASQGGRVSLELVALGVIEGTVETPVSLPPRPLDGMEGFEDLPLFPDPALGSGAQLGFIPLGDEGDGRRCFRQDVRFGKGFRIPSVAPGPWRIEVTSPYFEARSHELLVVGGRSHAVSFTLMDLRPRGTVKVRIVTAGGFTPWRGIDEAPDVSAMLTPIDPTGRGFFALLAADCGTGVDAWFRRVDGEGGEVLEVEFTDVAAGTYLIEPGPYGLFSNSPGLQYVPGCYVVQPGDEVEFEAVQSVSPGGLAFRVRDAATHDRVPSYRILPLARRGASPFATRTAAAKDEVRAFRLPVGDPADWCLSAPGYERAYGDRNSFRGEGELRYADVELRRGWGIRLRANDPAGEPVVGMTIRLNGVEQGRTDEAGRIYLRAAVRPRDPQLTFAGHRVVDGDIGVGGSFAEERLGELQVILVPRR